MAASAQDLPRLRAAHPGPCLQLLPLAASALLDKQRGDPPRGLAELARLLVVTRDPLEDHDRVAIRRTVPQAQDREAPDRLVGIRRGQRVQERAIGVHRRRAVPGKQLQRQQRRAAGSRALVLEPAAQELELLAVSKLADRAVGDGALAEIRAPRRAFELVVPLGAQRGELAFGARRCELVGFGRG
jgi:hypothetical protein